MHKILIGKHKRLEFRHVGLAFLLRQAYGTDISALQKTRQNDFRNVFSQYKPAPHQFHPPAHAIGYFSRLKFKEPIVKNKYILIALLIFSSAYAQAQTWSCVPPAGELTLTGRLIAQRAEDGNTNAQFILAVDGGNNRVCVNIQEAITTRYQMMRDAMILGLPVTISIRLGGARSVTVFNQ
jgi:hypothetical protein